MKKIKRIVVSISAIAILLKGGQFALNTMQQKNSEVTIADRKLIEKRLESLVDSETTIASEETEKMLIKEHGELRGVWITTAYQKDFPKAQYNVDAQKKELDKILDDVVSKGLNTVYFQVRPFADAFYKSEINPWSKYLTGQQGKDPKFDPLEYIIDASHIRGLQLHAWINPLRVSAGVKDVDSYINNLSDNHIAKNKDLIIVNNIKGKNLKEIYLNPEKEEVKNHLIDTVKEIANNYKKLDGIHMDDYFYPAYYPLPKGEGKDGVVANNRRDAITNIVYAISDSIKEANNNLEFSISPSAVTKNSDMNTKAGLQNYYDLYADIEKWIKDNKIDVIIPQLYFDKNHELVNFTKASQYWNNLVGKTNVKLVIGHQIDSVNKKEVINEIDEQVNDTRKLKNVVGNSYFGYSELHVIQDKLNKLYK